MQTRERGSRIQWPGRSFLETKQVYLTYLGTPVPIPLPLPPFLPRLSFLQQPHLCVESALRTSSFPLPIKYDSSSSSSSPTRPSFLALSLSLSSHLILSRFISSQLVVSSYPNSPPLPVPPSSYPTCMNHSLLAPVLAITSSFPKVSDRLTTIGIVRVYGRTWYVIIAKKDYEKSFALVEKLTYFILIIIFVPSARKKEVAWLKRDRE